LPSPGVNNESPTPNLPYPNVTPTPTISTLQFNFIFSIDIPFIIVITFLYPDTLCYAHAAHGQESPIGRHGA
jgi:hypothetical protein